GRGRGLPVVVVLVAAGVLGVGVGVGAADEARHAWTAVRRTGRVVGTLGVCVNDYRKTLPLRDEVPADEYAALLSACHQRCADRTLAALEANGSVFIKLGQHLSSLNYLLPSEWCDTFIPLQDRCPVSSYESIAAMVEADTGRPLTDMFSSFEEAPIGAASLAQVHRAVERGTGAAVAVKVQHPALAEWAPLDLALTSFTFAALKRVFPDYDLTWLAEELESSLPVELDFEREAANAERARAHFAAAMPDGPLVIPQVHWARPRILVMEYVAGRRVDDLAYLDGEGIDRDEVSAALARIFNEMIFGEGAPLHCDPHGGNIAIRRRRERPDDDGGGGGGTNFDVILYDHGLYRDIPVDLRRAYARLWLAVLEADEGAMRACAREVAGVTDEQFPLFASAITGRDYVEGGRGLVEQPRTSEEKEVMGRALAGGEGVLQQLVELLGRVPRVMLLILKTNDLTRSLDDSLQTRQGPARSFLILARYAARCVLAERVEALRAASPAGAAWWPPAVLLGLVRAWTAYAGVVARLQLFEAWVAARRWLGL
ncbi:ubiquinone biosynthesis protein, partial [Lineolata rhizophorae]